MVRVVIKHVSVPADNCIRMTVLGSRLENLMQSTNIILTDESNITS